MSLRLRHLCLLLWITAAAAVLTPACFAQGNVVRCSSDDERRNYCPADTRGGVQMSRQLSGSPCVQGSTWGYDNRGIWVDRGCRAEFTVGYGYGSGSGYGSGQTITCTSEDERRHYCPADTRGGVQVTRQHSGSPCTQGHSWGYDNRGIWVDRGCRAEFTLGSYGGGYGQGGGYGSAQTIRCSSDDERRNFCAVDTRGGVQLVRQISGSRCTQGYSWGFDRRGIWVDHGCRAEFRVGAGGYGPGGPGQGGGWGVGQGQRPQEITCSSDDGRRHFCQTGAHRNIELRRQLSGAPCVPGRSWGEEANGVWVDRGCRAEFRVRY